MATLSELLRGRTNLPDHDVEWLHLLVGDWQLVADLSFADLVLWVRSTSERWEAVAHVRPTTGQLVFVDDQVGRVGGSRAHAATCSTRPPPSSASCGCVRSSCPMSRARTSRSARSTSPSCEAVTSWR